MANPTGQDLRISIERDVVSIAIGHGTAVVPTTEIEALVTALKAAQMLVSGAPRRADDASVTSPPAPRAAAATTKAASTRAAAAKPAAAKPTAAPAAPVVAAPAKRRGRPPKHVDADGHPTAKRRSRKRVGDALEVWLRANPGWYSEAELLALVKREQMSDADPHRALKIALGKQKGSLFVTDEAGNWSLAETAAKAAKPAAKAKAAARADAKPARKGAAAAKPGRKSKADAKAEAAVKKTETAGRKRASASPRKRQSAGAGKKADMEGSPAGEAASAEQGTKAAAQGSRPVRVRKGQQREEVLHAGRPKPAAVPKSGGVITAVPEERERIRRNLFGD